MSTLYGIYLLQAGTQPVITQNSVPGEEAKGQPPENNKRIEAEKPSSACRRLRVQQKIKSSLQSDSSFPEIKLSGHWLAKLGFTGGQHVRITTAHHKIIIEPDTPG